MWWIYLLISIILSLLFVPKLTAGGSGVARNTEASFASENESRIMKPVVSQTCVSQPSINQMLPADPESVPGKQPSIWAADNLHYFDNTELVARQCGPAITSGVLNQWKNVEQDWQVKYSESALHNDTFKSIDEGAHLRKI